MVPEKRDEIGETVEINIRGVRGAVVRAEAVIHSGGKRAWVVRGLNIHVGIADQQGFGWRGAEFAEDRFRAARVRVFCFKAVAAVGGAKIFLVAEWVQDADADPAWL